MRLGALWSARAFERGEEPFANNTYLQWAHQLLTKEPGEDDGIA